MRRLGISISVSMTKYQIAALNDVRAEPVSILVDHVLLLIFEAMSVVSASPQAFSKLACAGAKDSRLVEAAKHEHRNIAGLMS